MNYNNNNSDFGLYEGYRQAPSAIPMKPPRIFSGVESVFAWVAIVCGYLFCRVFPVSRNPFGGLLFIIALFGVTTAVLCLTGKRPQTLSLLTAGSALLIALSLLLSSNPFIHMVSYLYNGVAYVYYVYVTTGNSIEKGIGELCFFDFIKALFVMPLLSITSVFLAAMGKNAKGSKLVFKIIIGVGLAIIPTAVIWGLLSFDNGFNELMGKIFKVRISTVISHIVSIILGIPVGMYIFGLFISSTDKKAQGVLTAESCRCGSGRIKIMSGITAVIAAAPVLALYVVFFIAQWNNYFSAFAGVLPGDEIYSQYARGGFFELCGVAVVNLIMIILASLFTKRRGERAGISVKILNTVISLFTLVLISTAMSKLVLYIRSYGLTPLRVYAAWFISLLALVFIYIIMRQFIHRMNLSATIIVTGILLFALLGLGGTDTIIAQYNVDHCIDGTLEHVDIGAMRELGDAAIPDLVRYRDTLDPENYEYRIVTDYLKEYTENTDEGFFGLTFPRERAHRAIKTCEFGD